MPGRTPRWGARPGISRRTPLAASCLRHVSERCPCPAPPGLCDSGARWPSDGLRPARRQRQVGQLPSEDPASSTRARWCDLRRPRRPAQGSPGPARHVGHPRRRTTARGAVKTRPCAPPTVAACVARPAGGATCEAAALRGFDCRLVTGPPSARLVKVGPRDRGGSAPWRRRPGRG